MSRILICLAVFGSFTGGAVRAQAQTLIAANDASQIEELQVVKVMARGASFWLGARLRGKARLALVTSDAAFEPAPAADAWLRALDVATRIRVAAPPGPLSSCGTSQDLAIVDTGLPDLPLIGAQRVAILGSELELRRALEDAGLPVDVERAARFASSARAPFRLALYDVPQGGGATAAVRVQDGGEPNAAPQIVTAGRDTVPLSLIALAPSAVLPAEGTSAEPSEFAVTYRAASATNPSSDYVTARASWLLEHPQRWLAEVQASAGLFSWSFLAPESRLAPAVNGYFQTLDSGCSDRVHSALSQGSRRTADFTCADHDDLARSLSELDFSEIRLSRLYGALGPDGVTFRIVESATRSSLLNATDLDRSACPPLGASAPVAGAGISAPGSNQSVVVTEPGTGAPSEPAPGTPVYADDGACNPVIVESGSCSGNSSSSDSSDESCSGDSTSGDSSDDSCSGESSSNAGDDSCSGNSDSSNDSDGCSKRDDGYDGDTCTGSSHDSAQVSSAALRSNGTQKHRARRAHLSLLTLLAAAFALPFRRRRAFRFRAAHFVGERSDRG